MAGLMLADKTAGLEEELRAAEKRADAVSVPVAAPVAAPAPSAAETIEVEVIPQSVIAAFSRIADRAEGVASQVEDAAAG